MNGSFALDKRNARLMGVCAGLANYTGIDLLILRVSLVVFSFYLAPATILLYLAAGFFAPEASEA